MTKFGGGGAIISRTCGGGTEIAIGGGIIIWETVETGNVATFVHWFTTTDEGTLKFAWYTSGA